MRGKTNPVAGMHVYFYRLFALAAGSSAGARQVMQVKS